MNLKSRGTVATILSLFLLSTWLYGQSVEFPKQVMIPCIEGTCIAKPEDAGVSNGIFNKEYTFEFTVSIDEDLNAKSIPKANVDEIGWVPESYIALHAVKSNWIFLKIPMKNGVNPSFNHVVKNVGKGDVIHISVQKSRELRIEKNEILVYTHRYQQPVFYVTFPETLVVKNIPNYKILKETVRLTYPSRDKYWIGIVSYLLIAITIAAFFFRLTRRYIQSKLQFELPRLDVRKLGFPWVVYSALWIASILPWLLLREGSKLVADRSPFGPLPPLFSDFFQIAQFGEGIGPYDAKTLDYPPFGVLISYFVNHSFRPFGFIFIFASTIGVILAIWSEIFDTQNKKWSITSLLNLALPLMCYPVIFGLARGNLDVVAGALIFSSTILYLRSSRFLAAVLLGIAIAMKIWPIVFILIFLKRKEFGPLLTTGVTSIVLTISSLLYFGYFKPAIWLEITVLPFLRGNYSISQTFQFNYSLKTPIYFIHLLFFSDNPPIVTNVDIGKSLDFVSGPNYLAIKIILFIIFGVLFWQAKTFELEYLILIGMSLLIPSPTYIYRGIILIPYIALRLLNAKSTEKISSSTLLKKRERRKVRVRSATSQRSPLMKREWLLFVVSISPLTFFYFGNSSVSIGSLIQPIAICGLIYLEYQRTARSNG